MSQEPNFPNPPVEGAAYPPAQKSKSALTIILIVAGAILASLVLMIGVLIALLLPAIQQVRAAARTSHAQNQVQKLVIGMHRFADQHKQLPDACTFDDQGKPLHSWRTQLIPFLGVLDAPTIDMEKPWNAPENQAAVQKHLFYFSSPRNPDTLEINCNKTSFVAVVDENTVIRKKGSLSLSDLGNRMSSIGILLEIPTSDIAWAEPRDVTIEEAISYIQNFRGHRGLIVGMADGTAKPVPSSTTAAQIRALFSVDE